MDDPTDGLSPSRWERVRNWAIQYIGIGWFLSQVLASLSREFGWSERVADLAVVLLGVGFVGTVGIAAVSRGFGRRTSRIRSVGVLVVAGVLGIGVWWLTGGGRSVEAGPMGMLSEHVPLLASRAEVSGQLFVYPFRPWSYSGIRLEEGVTVTVRADGQVHLSLEALFQAGVADEAPDDVWVGPSGELDASGVPLVRQDRIVPGRENCLLVAALPYGALLMAIAPGEHLSPREARGLRPGQDVFAVGDRFATEVTRSGFAHFAVNDVYLDDPACDPDFAAAGGDPQAFLADNLGFFTVQIVAR